jgi:hypothetical protein
MTTNRASGRSPAAVTRSAVTDWRHTVTTEQALVHSASANDACIATSELVIRRRLVIWPPLARVVERDPARPS